MSFEHDRARVIFLKHEASIRSKFFVIFIDRRGAFYRAGIWCSVGKCIFLNCIFAMDIFNIPEATHWPSRPAVAYSISYAVQHLPSLLLSYCGAKDLLWTQRHWLVRDLFSRKLATISAQVLMCCVYYKGIFLIHHMQHYISLTVIHLLLLESSVGPTNHIVQSICYKCLCNCQFSDTEARFELGLFGSWVWNDLHYYRTIA